MEGFIFVLHPPASFCFVMHHITLFFLINGSNIGQNLTCTWTRCIAPSRTFIFRFSSIMPRPTKSCWEIIHFQSLSKLANPFPMYIIVKPIKILLRIERRRQLSPCTVGLDGTIFHSKRFPLHLVWSHSLVLVQGTKFQPKHVNSYSATNGKFFSVTQCD